jgi:hypothetical protein
MRFMIIVHASAETDANKTLADIDPQVMAAMDEYHQQLAQAGVLLDAGGLQPSRKGWRVQYRAGKPRVVDGPFAEAKELVAGYTLIQVPSREAALEWSRRFPSPFGSDDCQVEVRQLYEQDDFAPSVAPGSL